MSLLAKPFTLLGGLLAVRIGRGLTAKVWNAVEPGDPPAPAEPDVTLRKVLAAAALEGVLVGVARALIRRGSARSVEHLTGHRPGERRA